MKEVAAEKVINSLRRQLSEAHYQLALLEAQLSDSDQFPDEN